MKLGVLPDSHGVGAPTERHSRGDAPTMDGMAVEVRGSNGAFYKVRLINTADGGPARVRLCDANAHLIRLGECSITIKRPEIKTGSSLRYVRSAVPCLVLSDGVRPAWSLVKGLMWVCVFILFCKLENDEVLLAC